MSDSISLFVPLYNEEKIVRRNIAAAYRGLRRLGLQVEIYLVDDNSFDKSRAICELLPKLRREIKYIRYDAGPSRRENLARSFCSAKYNIIGFFDLDLPHSPHYLPKLMDAISHGADVVVASRYANGSVTKRSPFRRMVSVCYNSVIRLLFHSKVKDHQCGFKIFKKESVLPIINEMGYDSTFTRGWFWDAELLIRAQRKGLKIVEIPFSWSEGNRSSFKLWRELKCLPWIWHLWRNFKR